MMRLCELALMSAIFTCGCCALAESEGDSSASPSTPTNAWLLRCEHARALARSSTENSFQQLLGLLRSEHPDVRYAAAQALESRGDVRYTSLLIEACSALPRDHRWPVYRAMGSYPSLETLSFLTEMTEDEIKHHAERQEQSGFDTRNLWYLAKSMRKVVALLKSEADVSPPSD